MRQIRRCVFETNSSSSHNMTICSAEDFERFREGEIVLDRYNNKLITDEDKPSYEMACKIAREHYKEGQEPHWKNWEDLTNEERDKFIQPVLACRDTSDSWRYIHSYYDYMHHRDSDGDYTFFKEDYTTPGGEKIVAFGYYGRNY